MPTLKNLRQYAYSRTFFPKTALNDAVHRLGFVQIDPITAPACAHDLILRHRVTDYQKGDIHTAYPNHALEEAFFINHGYLPRKLAQSLWSNKPPSDYLTEHIHQVQHILQFAQSHPEIHSKILKQQTTTQVVANAWGGTSHQSTELLQRMHRNGLLRIARRDKGTRVYALPINPPANEQKTVTLDDIAHQALTCLAQTYAPFTAKSLTYMCRLLAHCRADLKAPLQKAIKNPEQHFSSAIIDGQRWFWSLDENLPTNDMSEQLNQVRILTPFDPMVWDRDRFMAFWSWQYTFEAYKPAAKRQLGYYAMPLMWHDECIGWSNLSVQNNALHADIGYIKAPQKSSTYRTALEYELEQLRQFLRSDAYTIGTIQTP